MVVLKSRQDLAAMRLAGKISAQALALGGRAVKPGVTTGSIDKIIHDFIVSNGAVPSFLGYGGFPGSACISINDQVIHGIPSEKIVVQEGDIVSIDVGAHIGGYHGDNAATFGAGEVSPEAQALMDATRESLYEGIKMAQVGNRVGDIGYAVEQYCRSRGYGVVKEWCGHGVGRSLHEEPEVPNHGKAGRGPRLVAGMTIAIEPMINGSGDGVRTLGDEWTVVTTSGSLSAHFEHTVAITEDGPVILTRK